MDWAPYEKHLLTTELLGPRTVAVYLRVAHRIVDSGVTAAEWLRATVQPETPDGTAKGYASAARHFYAWQKLTGVRLLGEEPSLPRKRRARRQAMARDSMSIEQLQEFEEAVRSSKIPRKVKAALLLMAWTGLRIHEAAGFRLDWLCNVGGKYGAMVVGKGNKTRWVPIEKEARGILRAYFAAEKPDSEYLFPGRPKKLEDGTFEDRPITPAAIRKHWRNTLRPLLGTWADDRLVPHSLRHTFATHVLEASGDLKGLSAILGHTKTSTTADLYTHPQASQLASAVADLTKFRKVKPAKKPKD